MDFTVNNFTAQKDDFQLLNLLVAENATTVGKSKFIICYKRLKGRQLGTIAKKILCNFLSQLDGFQQEGQKQNRYRYTLAWKYCGSEAAIPHKMGSRRRNS